MLLAAHNKGIVVGLFGSTAMSCSNRMLLLDTELCNNGVSFLLQAAPQNLLLIPPKVPQPLKE